MGTTRKSSLGQSSTLVIFFPIFKFLILYCCHFTHPNWIHLKDQRVDLERGRLRPHKFYCMICHFLGNQHLSMERLMAIIWVFAALQWPTCDKSRKLQPSGSWKLNIVSLNLLMQCQFKKKKNTVNWCLFSSGDHRWHSPVTLPLGSQYLYIAQNTCGLCLPNCCFLLICIMEDICAAMYNENIHSAINIFHDL